MTPTCQEEGGKASIFMFGLMTPLPNRTRSSSRPFWAERVVGEAQRDARLWQAGNRKQHCCHKMHARNGTCVEMPVSGDNPRRVDRVHRTEAQDKLAPQEQTCPSNADALLCAPRIPLLHDLVPSKRNVKGTPRTLPRVDHETHAARSLAATTREDRREIYSRM